MGKNQGIIEDCREAENDSVTDDVEQLLIKNLDLKDHLYKGLGPDSTRYRKIFLISQEGRNIFKKKKKKLTTLQCVLLPVSEDSTFLQSIMENGLSELLDKTERGEVLVSIENWLCVKCMTNLAKKYSPLVGCVGLCLLDVDIPGKDWGSLLIADNDTDIEYAEAFKSDLENTKKVLTSKGPRIMGIREEYVFTVLQAELDTIDKTDMHALRVKFKFKKIRKLDIDPLVVYISCHGKTGQNHAHKFQSNNHVLSTRGLKTLLKSIKKVKTFILFMDRSYPTEIMFFSKDKQISIKLIQINSCESDMTRLFTKYLIEGLNPRGQKENSNVVMLTKNELITANTLHKHISQQFKRGQDQHRQQKPEFKDSHDALKIECYTENVTIDFDHDNETNGLDVDLYQTMEDFGDALKQLFNSCFKSEVNDDYSFCDNIDVSEKKDVPPRSRDILGTNESSSVPSKCPFVYMRTVFVVLYLCTFLLCYRQLSIRNLERQDFKSGYIHDVASLPAQNVLYMLAPGFIQVFGFSSNFTRMISASSERNRDNIESLVIGASYLGKETEKQNETEMYCFGVFSQHRLHHGEYENCSVNSSTLNDLKDKPKTSDPLIEVQNASDMDWNVESSSRFDEKPDSEIKDSDLTHGSDDSGEARCDNVFTVIQMYICRIYSHTFTSFDDQSSKQGSNFPGILMVVVCYLLCCGITKINIGGGHIIRRDFSQLAICETSFYENNIETKPADNLPEEQTQDDRSDRTAFNDNAVTQLSKDRRIKCIKESENTMIRNTKQSEDSCDPFALIRRLQYGVQSQTPHEVDVNEEKNIVSLRNKQPVPYDILQFLIEFCKLKKQNNMKTARHFFFQEIESVTANITDLKEIELSGKEVTDSLHRDSQVEDSNLEISAVESLSAATAFKCLLKNNTIPVERKRLFFPQNSMERHLYVPTVTPKTSERTDILRGGQRDRMSKDFKYKVAPSMSYKKENEDDRSYFKHNKYASKLWPTPFDETGELIRRLTEIPQPQIDIKYARRIIEVFFVFEPLMNIVDLIALGKPPAPHVSMRYELLRFCTLRSYPKDDKPYLIKLAEAGFYYASDGDGVVCYCCGIRRYNWTADDQPLKIHKRINPTCKFLIKNEEVNVRNNYNGPFSKSLMFIDSILEPEESQEPTEDVNNDWAPERTRSPASRALNNESTGSSSQLGISTAIPKHSQYATKTSRLASFNGWPDTASHTPDVLADAGFFFAGFGDCVRCFYCGIGLRHWTQDDNPWIEHARWAKNCVFVKQKKGEEFVNLVQLAVQYSQDNATEENNGGNQLSPQEIENVLLSDAAQSVLDMGYQPRIIKKAIEQIIRQNRQAKITAQFLMEKILEIEEGSNETPGTLVSPGAATSTVGATGTTEGATGSSLNESLKKSAEPEKKHKGGKPEDKKSSNTKEKNDKEKIITKANVDVSKEKSSFDPTSQQDPKAIKAENEQLKEQTICKICLDQTVSIVFLPCGHLVTCADCAPAMRKCPICRALVKGTVRTYMS